MFCSDEDVDDLFLFVLFCFFLDTFPSTVSLCIISRISVATICIKFGRSKISIIPNAGWRRYITNIRRQWSITITANELRIWLHTIVLLRIVAGIVVTIVPHPFNYFDTVGIWYPSVFVWWRGDRVLSATASCTICVIIGTNNSAFGSNICCTVECGKCDWYWIYVCICI